MSRRFSKLSIAKDITENQTYIQERARLVGLVKTWRLKHDKLLASAQQHQAEVQKLKLDIARLKEEKGTITNHLTTQLQNERSTNKAAMQELRREAEVAREKPEVKSRYLEQKLKKLESETEPIITFYKKRDKEMTDKVESLKQEVESLQDDKNALQMEISRFRNESKLNQFIFKPKLRDAQEGNKHIRSSLPCLRRLERVSKEEIYLKMTTSPPQTPDVQKADLNSKIVKNIQNPQNDNNLTSDISELDRIDKFDCYKPSEIVSLFNDFWFLQWT